MAKMTDVEQQEYIQHLQAGRREAPTDSPLEGEAVKRLREISQGIQRLNDARNRADKQLEALRAQIQDLDSNINRQSGELNAYATLLISAEQGRRTDAEPPPPIPEGVMPSEEIPDPTDETPIGKTAPIDAGNGASRKAKKNSTEKQPPAPPA